MEPKMPIVIYCILLYTSFTGSMLAQASLPIMSYATILDDFAKNSVQNLNFQNGINVFIEKPEDDVDALYQGFRITHTNGEYNGGWKVLYAKDIIIKEEIPLHFRAVLYLFKNKRYIALYKEEDINKYYFRIFDAVY